MRTLWECSYGGNQGEDLWWTMAGAIAQTNEILSRHCDFLTPRVDISFAGLDEYAIRKKIIESKILVNADTKDKVFIEGLELDDEYDVSEVSPVKTNETQTAKTQVDKIGQTSKKAGIGFKKIKAYFIWWSKSNLRPNEKRALQTINTARPVSTARSDHAMVDSGCSSHMTSNKLIFSDYEITMEALCFGSDPKGSKNNGLKGTGPNWMFDLNFLTNTINYIPVSVENQVNVDAGSSGKDKGPTQEYILLPLHPHRIRIPVEDVALAAHEKPSKISPKDNDVQDSEDVADKEGQHQMTEDEQVLHDELEKIIAQQVVAKALDDATRQAFEEEKWNIASQKREAHSTSINKLSTGRSSVSTTTTPYVSAASTPTGANAGESSFVYLGGKMPIDASTLPNADLPIDPNMPDLEVDSDAFSNDSIFNGAYDDENVGAVADFNNMDDTINVSPILTLKIHKDHLKDQILGDPKSAVQTRGKIQQTSSAQQALNISQALQDESWVEAMQEELLQFKLQKVWKLVDLPSGKKIEDKYVADILKEFDFWSIRTATTPIESNKPLVKDEDGEDVDVHVYRSMIGSLMDFTFELEAFLDSDYEGANLDRKSTTEYVAAANCCGQVLWIQNQMMDYGFNFMNTIIHIDNESTISVIKNPVAYSRTKHIEIRFHLISDCYEKRLIEVIKIHTDSNVVDLLTKGFDVTRFNFLVVSIGMLNL
ncbi:hypothetical protein Tco_0771329 [Tanacetum coccineum]|uniref:Uncharacterized protein n=1 Tax=Tanacetum coccineum TaxID=301880 RepID=A0ABQ4ZEQ6_9ASTR